MKRPYLPAVFLRCLLLLCWLVPQYCRSAGSAGLEQPLGTVVEVWLAVPGLERVVVTRRLGQLSPVTRPPS